MGSWIQLHLLQWGSGCWMPPLCHQTVSPFHCQLMFGSPSYIIKSPSGLQFLRGQSNLLVSGAIYSLPGICTSCRRTSLSPWDKSKNEFGTLRSALPLPNWQTVLVRFFLIIYRFRYVHCSWFRVFQGFSQKIVLLLCVLCSHATNLHFPMLYGRNTLAAQMIFTWNVWKVVWHSQGPVTPAFKTVTFLFQWKHCKKQIRSQGWSKSM